MESTAEVLRVVGAIVSAFQTAADPLEFLKYRKVKKKRKREKGLLELLEIKNLHKPLVEVRKASAPSNHGSIIMQSRAARDVASTARTDINSSAQRSRLATLLQPQRSKM
jgi:hypothetical protein